MADNKKKSEYKRTSRKVTIKGKQCTVYLRRKDGVECVRRKNKDGKTVYRKVSKATKTSPKLTPKRGGWADSVMGVKELLARVQHGASTCRQQGTCEEEQEGGKKRTTKKVRKESGKLQKRRRSNVRKPT